MSDSQYIKETKTAGDKDKYFTFWLNGQLFAIPIGHVVQIVGLPPLTPIPESPCYLKGIMNVRGALIPTIDLRTRFSLPEVEHDDRTSVIIIHIGGRQISVIADGVSEVASIPAEEFTKKQDQLGGYISDYITDISIHNTNIILHLDLDKLFADIDLQYI